MAYGKIDCLTVYYGYSGKADNYRVGQPIMSRDVDGNIITRYIETIKDAGNEFDSGIFTCYQLFDKNENLIAQFENGTYATWFDDAEKVIK